MRYELKINAPRAAHEYMVNQFKEPVGVREPLTLAECARVARGDYSALERKYFERLRENAEFLASYGLPARDHWLKRTLARFGCCLIIAGIALGGRPDE